MWFDHPRLLEKLLIKALTELGYDFHYKSPNELESRRPPLTVTFYWIHREPARTLIHLRADSNSSSDLKFALNQILSAYRRECLRLEKEIDAYNKAWLEENPDASTEIGNRPYYEADIARNEGIE